MDPKRRTNILNISGAFVFLDMNTENHLLAQTFSVAPRILRYLYLSPNPCPAICAFTSTEAPSQQFNSSQHLPTAKRSTEEGFL